MSKQVEHQHRVEEAKERFKRASQAFNEGSNHFQEYLTDCLTLAEELDEKEIIAETLLMRAEDAIIVQKNDIARTDLNRVDSILKENFANVRDGIPMRYYFLKGNLAYIENNPLQARYYYLHALNLIPAKSSYDRYKSILYNSLANSEELIGDVGNAINHYIEAIRVFPKSALTEDEINDPSSHLVALEQYAHLYCSLAELCLSAGDYESAHSYLYEAQNVGTGSKRILCEIQRVLASVMLAKGEVEAALTAAQESFALGSHTDGKAPLLGAIVTLAKVLIIKKDYNSTVELLEYGIDTSDDSDLQCESFCLLSIAYANIAKQDNALDVKAKESLTKAEMLIQSVSELQSPACYKSLSDAKFLLGDVLGAYETIRVSNEKKEALYSAKVRNEVGSIRLLLDLERKEQEKKLEQMKREQTEKELANSTMHLAMQTELLGNFRNDLRQIVRDIDEPISALRKIKEKLKELPCEQIDWAKFEKEFTSVHPEFKTKLIEKYPDLTKQEVKMCQLARLGLRNIEVAQLLCLSERSVETHRFNLRKKLGLKTEQKLSQFLATIK